jgi:hypothetical protein
MEKLMVQTLVRQPTEMEICPGYKNCSAPLCPLDDKTLETAIWFPDEPICTRHGLPDTKWLRIQRRIAKKAKTHDTFYRISDLQRIQRVYSSIRGHNPNITCRDKGDTGGSDASSNRRATSPRVKAIPRQRPKGKAGKQPVAQLF